MSLDIPVVLCQTKNGQLFNDGQRHFVLGSVFVADKEDEIEILNKYRQFKNRFRIYRRNKKVLSL